MITALAQKSQSTVQSVNIINDLEKNDNLLSNATPTFIHEEYYVMVGGLQFHASIGDQQQHVITYITIPKDKNKQNNDIFLFEVILQYSNNPNKDKYIDGYYFECHHQNCNVYLNCINNIIKKNNDKSLQMFFEKDALNKLYILYINNQYIIFSLNNNKSNIAGKLKILNDNIFLKKKNHQIST